MILSIATSLCIYNTANPKMLIRLTPAHVFLCIVYIRHHGTLNSDLMNQAMNCCVKATGNNFLVEEKSYHQDIH